MHKHTTYTLPWPKLIPLPFIQIARNEIRSRQRERSKESVWRKKHTNFCSLNMYLVCLTYFLLMVMYVFISIYVWCLCSILRKFPENNNNKHNQNRNLFCRSQFIWIWITFKTESSQAIAHYKICQKAEKKTNLFLLRFYFLIFFMPWNRLFNRNSKMKSTQFLLNVRTNPYRRRWQQKLMANCIDKSVNKSGP